jgi:hypothetical protein
MHNSGRVRAAAAVAVLAGVLGTGAVATGATGTDADALTPYGPARVEVPYTRIYAFRVQCAAVPCTIRLTQHFYAHGRSLPALKELQPGPIVMSSQPSLGQPFATWYARSDFNQPLLNADLSRYGSLTLKLTGRVTDAAGGSASAARTITLVPTPLPVLIAGSYRGRRPSSIYISGDGGDIVTGLSWDWTASHATGEGTSNIQNCIPNCAAGTDTPVPTSIVLLDPTNGYFTKLVEQRNGQTEVFYYTPGQYPDNWPQGAS